MSYALNRWEMLDRVERDAALAPQVEAEQESPELCTIDVPWRNQLR
jgi:hypothetical protein